MTDVAAPAEPVAEPTEAPTPEPAQDPSLPPRYSELGSRAAEAKARKEAEAQREQDAKDAALWRALQEKGFQPPQRQEEPKGVTFDPDDPSSLREALGPAKYRAFLQAQARHVNNPEQFMLERRLQELQGQKPEGYEDLQSKVDLLLQQQMSAREAHVHRVFIEGTEAQEEGEDGSASPRYPLLSRIPPARRLRFAQQVIADYEQMGYDRSQLTNDFVMAQTEEFLSELSGAWAPSEPAPAPEAVPVPKPKRPQDGPRRAPQGSRSLTNEVATPRGSTRPMTMDERTALATARLAARRASRP